MKNDRDQRLFNDTRRHRLRIGGWGALGHGPAGLLRRHSENFLLFDLSFPRELQVLSLFCMWELRHSCKP